MPLYVFLQMLILKLAINLVDIDCAPRNCDDVSFVKSFKMGDRRHFAHNSQLTTHFAQSPFSRLDMDKKSFGSYSVYLRRIILVCPNYKSSYL